MEIIKFYSSILRDAGLVVDAEGFVSVNNKLFNKADKNDPVLIDGKRLVLPTYNQLSDPNGENKIRFHPLSENLMLGESVVIAKLRSLFATKLNVTIAAVMNALLDICASINTHKKLNPDQSVVLTIAPSVDEETIRVFQTMIVRAMVDNNAFIRFYLKRSGVVGNQKYSRAGVVSFPMYEELNKDQENYYGVKLRKKDKECILNLFKFVLKNIDKPDSYNRGSNSDVAPFLDALMKTVMAVATEINDVIQLYSDKVEDLESLLFEAEYWEVFKDLSVMNKEIIKIPVQSGNEGEFRKTENQAAAVSNPQLTYVPPPVAQPQAQPAPVVNVPQVQQVAQPMQHSGSSEGKADFSSIFNKATGTPPQMAMPVAMNPAVYQAPVVLPPSLQPPMPAGQQPMQMGGNIVTLQNGMVVQVFPNGTMIPVGQQPTMPQPFQMQPGMMPQQFGAQPMGQFPMQQAAGVRSASSMPGAGVMQYPMMGGNNSYFR